MFIADRLKFTTTLESFAEKAGRIMRKLHSKMAFVLVCHLWLLNEVCASTPLKNQRARTVKIYLRNDAMIKADSPVEEQLGLFAVSRIVAAATPARGALKALIAGPTSGEKNKGFESPHAENLSIRRLVIKNGLARISLRSTTNLLRWPGDTAPSRFESAISLTLKQFPTVKRVRICLDGEELGSIDGGPKRCQ